MEQILTYQTLVLALVFVFLSPPTTPELNALIDSLGGWPDYIAPVAAHLLLIRVHPAVMIVLGVLGIVGAALLPFEPRLGPYVVATWLGSVVIHFASLFTHRGRYPP